MLTSESAISESELSALRSCPPSLTLSVFFCVDSSGTGRDLIHNARAYIALRHISYFIYLSIMSSIMPRYTVRQAKEENFYHYQ